MLLSYFSQETILEPKCKGKTWEKVKIEVSHSEVCRNRWMHLLLGSVPTWEALGEDANPSGTSWERRKKKRKRPEGQRCCMLNGHVVAHA